jgi:ubiquinol-cytochrome c reductase cytochrome c1 subunit
MKKQIITFMGATLLATSIFAAGSSVPLMSANTDIHNQASLQNGAKLFMNYCSGCHSIKFMRYNRMAADLGLSNEQVRDNLMFAGDKVGDNITSNISNEGANKWFGTTPPDLSLTARSRGTDWIYSYLLSFYKDDSRPFGVNNHILAGASMPDVLWSLKESKSALEFKQDVQDITNFLDYVGEPAKLIRTSLGWWVLGFLTILLVLSYLLKKEYWRDIKYGKWKAKP